MLGESNSTLENTDKEKDSLNNAASVIMVGASIILVIILFCTIFCLCYRNFKLHKESKDKANLVAEISLNCEVSPDNILTPIDEESEN